MNNRFEPDGTKFMTWMEDMFKNDKKMEKEIENEKELDKFIEENIYQSNFSTRLSDAHRNVNANYKIVDANEDMLKSRYLKGSSPNKLLDKKENRQRKINYNEGQIPSQEFPGTKGSMMIPDVSRKTQNENNNEGYNDFGYDENDFYVDDNYEDNNDKSGNNEKRENFGMRENY